MTGSGVDRQMIERHCAFVGADVAESEVVGSPRHQTGVREFFLIYPVGGAVDDFAGFAVGSYGYFGVIVEFCGVYVVSGHERNHAGVGREHRYALACMLLRERTQQTRAYFIDVVFGKHRAAVDSLRIAPHHHFRCVGAEDEAFEVGQDCFAGICHVEQFPCFLAGRYIFNQKGFAVFRALYVALAVGHERE